MPQGDSPKAYDANVNVMFMVAHMYLLRRRYPHVLLSIENPLASLMHHPLIRHLVELPVSRGGLGMRFVPLAVRGGLSPWRRTHELP